LLDVDPPVVDCDAAVVADVVCVPDAEAEETVTVFVVVVLDPHAPTPRTASATGIADVIVLRMLREMGLIVRCFGRRNGSSFLPGTGVRVSQGARRPREAIRSG